MALIQKIREKSALVLILMVLAIISFIAMLITQDSSPDGSGGLNRFSNTSTVVKVGGKELDIKQLESTAQIMYGNQANDLSVRNTIFNSFVESALIGKEAEKVGLGVGKDELLELEFGANPSPVITSNQAIMQNPQQLVQIKDAIQKNSMPLQGKMYWAEIENQIITERLQAKLNNLTTKAIYTPTWLVEEGYKELTKPVDFEYVKVAFDKVDDKEAAITDADYEAYLKENRGRYMNDEEGRTLEYVTFDVNPSAEDSARIREKVLAVKEVFRTTDKDSAFAISHGGVLNPQYMTKETAMQSIKDSLFTAPIGTVIGPFVESKSYLLAKLIDRRSSPDSVRSRHILIQGENAIKTADSLKGLLEANASLWDSLNAKYSQDNVAKLKGGDLDYFAQGSLATEFNDLIFYKAQQGKFYTVTTQFGAHVVQVTGIKAGKNETRVKVAYARESLIPSQATDKAAADAADALLLSSKNLEELKKNALAKNLPLQPTQGFRINDQALGTLGQAEGVRQIIRWAYEASAGERCKSTFGLREQGDAYNSKYVVAALKSIIPKGAPSVQNLKEQLTPYVKNRKKGEVLKSKITSTDLNAVVAQFNGKIDTAKGVTFNSTFVPNLGSESRVVGTAFTTEVGQTSKPIIGDNGVYVIKVTSKNTVESASIDKNILRQQMAAQISGQLRGSISRYLRKKSEIVDNRSKFF
jgi:peptidyl-prolyl cis-trans isomerase D